ncbi:protein SGT1 homolog A isoform X2 [Ricinus communis]|uniref:protein SGT1 homolog A isoform X2 n=1 Tax=Ricinus communis TaxID=3988 RepID=UPI00201ADC5B|nr:protein SGT1 homolog A isoform X2 [Ricinus communis]
MAQELAEKAKEAIFEDDFKLAIDLYSKAIDLDPTNPEFFADRAQANIKLNNFTEAVADANKAIELDPLKAKAYLRKGTACIKLEEYHTAKTALEKGVSLARDDSRFTKLIEECNQRIAEESNDLSKSLAPSVSPVSVISPQMVISSAKPKYRHEYYQKPEEVIVTIFAKGIPAKNVTVDFGEQILSVTIDVPGEDAYHFQPRLFGKIVPDKSQYQVLSTKIEIRLAKAEVINWTSLEYCKENIVPRKLNAPSVGSQRPLYPSSKTRAKDWDKLEAEVKKEEKDERLDGDAALNKMFRDIYQNADEDMRRAMMKSFVESSGTVLSTDWKEVGSKKVEGSAPEGMEMRKWEY